MAYLDWLTTAPWFGYPQWYGVWRWSAGSDCGVSARKDLREEQRRPTPAAEVEGYDVAADCACAFQARLIHSFDADMPDA
jgi:hypothetical protein